MSRGPSTVRFVVRRPVLRVELLEDRSVPSVFTPAQIRHAYGFDQVAATGAGQTVAIVDAYDDPAIANDLAVFSAQFGLPAASFTKVNQTGGTAYPAFDAGWAGEIALDVEWVHAIAPGANILLVEANSASFTDLLAAVDYARGQPGVSAVSMSWGSGEFTGEAGYDAHFTTPAGHAGVTFVASSGDTGAVVEWPAVSRNVLGVGGTSLTAGSDGTYVSETGWSGSGGGKSRYVSKPDFQGYVTTGSTTRSSPDVAYDADPNTGVYVYDTSSPGGGWFQVGGTSAAAPQWAALVALADQQRASLPTPQPSLDGATQTLYAIYRMGQTAETTDFHDVTSGHTGSRRGGLNAGTGYDLVTGLGTPKAAAVVNALVNWTGTNGTGHSFAATPTQPPAGTGTKSLVAVVVSAPPAEAPAAVAPSDPSAANPTPGNSTGHTPTSATITTQTVTVIVVVVPVFAPVPNAASFLQAAPVVAERPAAPDSSAASAATPAAPAAFASYSWMYANDSIAWDFGLDRDWEWLLELSAAPADDAPAKTPAAGTPAETGEDAELSGVAVDE